MNPETDTQNQIVDTAALWLVECAEGLSLERQREFEAWQRQDPRHAAAVRKLQWGQSLLQKLPGVRDQLEPAPTMPTARTAAIPFPRPRWHRTLAACAAVLLVGLLAWWQWPQAVPPAENYACASGGYQRVLLRDGSVLELNENSSVRVTFTAEVRRVTLQTGEAHFRVAKDSRRPFVVAAGDVAVRAVGTAFLVRVDPASVNLLVTEGRVAVTESNPAAARIGAGDPAASDGPHLVDVSAGEQTKIPRHTHPDRRGEKPAIERPTAAAIRLALSWQEKRLVFAAVPLGAKPAALTLLLDHDGQAFVRSVATAFSYNQAWHEVDAGAPTVFE